MSFKVAIGLEVHVQLRAKTKIFCRCPVVGSGDLVVANAASCPICQGHPGVLPEFNPDIAKLGLICGLALNCRPQEHSIFERKHYFYPDIPKNYQLTQNQYPIAKNGYLKLRDAEGKFLKKIRIRQVHMEEDAAKNEHRQAITLVDFNRCGTPLLEIVSEPDLATPQEAEEYFKQVQWLVRWNGLSNADMEAGEMRCDANISVRPEGLSIEDAGSWRWELKNLNSPRSVQRALKLAGSLQMDRLRRHSSEELESLLRDNPRAVIRQQTYGYDLDRNQLKLQRTKEDADDYFYFVEPDLQPVVLNQSQIEETHDAMRPALFDRQQALLEESLTWSYVKDLTRYPEWYDFFVVARKHFEGPLAKLANWMTRDLLKIAKQNLAQDRRKYGIRITPEVFAAFVRCAEEGQIVSARSGEVLEDLWSSGETAPLAAAERLGARVDESVADAEIESVVRQLTEDNPGPAQQLRAGKDGLANFFVGKTMARFQGKANPKKVREIALKVIRG